MCLNPILRPNTNRGLAHIGLNFLKDCENQFIRIPCGHCPECIAIRQNALIQRVENESRYSYLYFCTLTYDNKHLPSLDILVPKVVNTSEPDKPLVPICPDDAEKFLDSEDFDFGNVRDDFETPKDGEYIEAVELQKISMPYAEIKHIQLLLKNLRDNNPCPGRRLRYLAVSELGKRRARPHFHILFFVEKLPADDKFTPLNMEKPLREYIKTHWAVNVGTRKNPVWEPRFTYRKRFYGGKLYQNFDLHYVNPNLTSEGVQNVAYYVSKYMLKASPKEEARQQFLKLNLQEEQYEKVWKQIKCKLLISKGLGLDASFETVERVEYVPLPLDEFAALYDADDLPPDASETTKRVIIKRRIMIPNFELCQWLHDTMRRGLSDPDNPHPIYVDLCGKHRPLARYYQNKSYIYTTLDAMDFWFNSDPDKCRPHWQLSPEEKDKLFTKYYRQVKAVDSHGEFDLLSSAMDKYLYDGDDSKLGCVHRACACPDTVTIRLGTDEL